MLPAKLQKKDKTQKKKAKKQQIHPMLFSFFHIDYFYSSFRCLSLFLVTSKRNFLAMIAF